MRAQNCGCSYKGPSGLYYHMQTMHPGVQLPRGIVCWPGVRCGSLVHSTTYLRTGGRVGTRATRHAACSSVPVLPPCTNTAYRFQAHGKRCLCPALTNPCSHQSSKLARFLRPRCCLRHQNRSWTRPQHKTSHTSTSRPPMRQSTQSNHKRPTHRERCIPPTLQCLTWHESNQRRFSLCSVGQKSILKKKTTQRLENAPPDSIVQGIAAARRCAYARQSGLRSRY